MDSMALKKKRELLLGGTTERKMSLRKSMENLKPNDCRLDINQITKCVFLGNLFLKPVPHLFDSPLLLKELDAKMGNVQETVIDENQNGFIADTLTIEKIDKSETNKRKIGKRKCLNTLKMRKNSLKPLNSPETERIESEFIKLEASGAPRVGNSVTEVNCVEELNLIVPPEISITRIPPVTRPQQTKAVDKLEIIDKKIDMREEAIDLSLFGSNFAKENPEEIKHIQMQNDLFNEFAAQIAQNEELDEDLMGDPLDDDATENELLLKREKTPEILLLDSDDDAIDQLMFNIMDIKVKSNVFDKDFFDIPPSDIEPFEEFTSEFKEKSDPLDPNELVGDKDKKFLKRINQCKICSQVFSSYVKLKRHKKDHDGEKPYLCVRCGENHTSLDNLLAHLRTHEGKRPYECKKCHKSFRTTKALEAHQPVHVLKKVVSPKKVFSCTVCGKEFRKLCDLERHTRVHTGEKPAVCNICNRRFQQAHNLNKHLLIHTKIKPYQCDICSKRFGRSDVLNRHLLTHSVQKPNSCEVCQKSFIRISQLLAHKDKCHRRKAASNKRKNVFNSD